MLNGTIQLMAYWCQWISGEFTLNVHSLIIGVNPHELESYDFAPADIPLVKKANPKKPNKLLFVANRKEILSQSLACFRGILKDMNFGSMMVGGLRPDSFEHLFVSIQSLNSKELTELTASDYYDYVCVEEDGEGLNRYDLVLLRDPTEIGHIRKISKLFCASYEEPKL